MMINKNKSQFFEETINKFLTTVTKKNERSHEFGMALERKGKT